MLVWVVIDRQHLRQAAPFASLRSSPLFPLAHLSPLLPVAYALPLATAAPQPLCNQSVTHSFYLDGGYTPLRAAPTTAILSAAYPLLHISCIFNLLRTPLHFFALPKNSTLLFSSDSALFAKKRGEGVSQRSASSCGVLGNSAWSKWATLSAPRHASHESPVTSHESPSSDSGEPKST